MNYDIASIAGIGIVFLFLYLILTGLMIALAIWIQYTIIWRAVRRGLSESGFGDVRYK